MTLRERHKVTYMYFMMSVLVILIHSLNNETVFQMFFSEKGIGQFAVPLFFVISGFLFFRTVKNISDVKIKLRKKVYTLLIPYLLWNLIYYAIHLLIKPGLGMTIESVLDAAFNYRFNPAFWFMYQLILLNILSIVFYYALRDYKYIFLFFLLISLFIIFNIDIPYVNEDAIIYYFSGAFISKLYNAQKVKFINKINGIILLIITVIVFILNRALHSLIFEYSNIVGIFTLSIVCVRLVASLTIFYLSDLIFSYERVYPFMENTFFLYAIHYMIVKALIIFMKYFTYKYMVAASFVIVETIVFIMSPVICVVISYYLSNFLKRRSNKLYNLLSGYR